VDPVTAVAVAVRDELADLDGGDLVLVACSGGPDSLALAAALARLTGRPGRRRAGAVVVDHGWSPESSAAAAAVPAVLRRLGLDPVELVPVVCDGPGGPEAAARDARYAALEQAADRTGARAVLLGHTLDDQAETVLLGLARGSGARSLAGMPRRRGIYRRPLLGVRRTTTLAACAALGLDPWHDPANDDPRHLRVRVRALAGELASALGPGTAEGLARTADLLAEDAAALEEAADRLLASACTARTAGTGCDRNGGPACPHPVLEAGVLLAAPTAVRRRALLAAARSAGSRGPARVHALTMERVLDGGGRVHLPSGVMAAVACGRLQFLPTDE
jgi:tRNA(Ile)-lysidine synthase